MSEPKPQQATTPRILIIGAGPGGIGMGIRLKQAGIEGFEILEKASGFGGTWFHNRYPGCECDIPSHLYSYSFEVKSDWSKPYAPQAEILAYLEHCVDKYGVRPFFRFDSEVTGAVWDDAAALWRVTTADGRVREAEVVVSAIGMFNRLAMPDIEGLERFAGTAFHSARWDWNHDITGERLAVIGSAASAVQLVPEVIKTAAHVKLFQRTANWVLPKEDTPYTEEQLAEFRANPEIAHFIRKEIFDGIESGDAFYNAASRAEMEATVLAEIAKVEDPETRRKLTPSHVWGCKRPLFANTYYPAFNSPKLELITEPIERIEARGVVTRGGVLHEVDTLVLATGFSATEYLSAIDVRGRDGLRIDDAWSDGAQAYLGVTTAGFPNLFMLYGPNTNQGSLITMIEWQIEHAVLQIQRIAAEGLRSLEVDEDVMATFNERIQREIEDVEPWRDGGCNNYYRSPSGRVVTQWPHSMGRFRDALSAVDPQVYRVERR